MSELISIIITSYNAGKYLEQCIDSALRQTYTNIEIILVNDGSKDNTEEIAVEYAEKYNNIKYFFQENSGVSVARNVGINNANGKCIMFVDGDDYLDEHIVEQLAAEMGNSDIICCCCKAFTESETFEDHFFSSSFISKSQEEKEKLYLQLLNGNAGKPNGKGYTAIGVPWGKLYRLDFLKNNKIFFDPKLKRMQDNMFNMYAFYYADQIKYVNAPLYYYRLDHIQNKKVVYDEDIWIQLLLARKKFFDIFPQIRSGAVMSAKFYEENIALYVMSVSTVQQNKIYVALKGLSKIRNNEIFTTTFSNYRKIKTPIQMTAFRILLKYKLYLLIVICIKITCKIRS